MRAWTFQDSRQKKKLGDKAPWSVGWFDPNGKKRSKRVGSKSMAEKLRRKREGELAAGLYRNESHKSWRDFRREFEERILPALAPKTREAYTMVLNHFERICKPQKVAAIKTPTIDEFTAHRQRDPGRKVGSLLSPASVNHDLRHLKAALRIAHEWEYLPVVPKFRKVLESEQIGPVITEDHFQAVYEACDVATMPKGLHCEAAEWWRGVLVFAITTGWRIEEILCFRREDLDLETGAILTRASDNKGNRDDMDYLADIALKHVKAVIGFHPGVFHWTHNMTTLRAQFHRIQIAAGIHLPCRDPRKHECSDACHLYGFHALRRGYATMNCDTMSSAVLQKKMRHKSFETTLRYISLAGKMKKAADAVHVPGFLKKQA